MLIDCILVEIKETKLTTFDLKRNDALQNNLVQFLKYLAESFDNLKIEQTRNVELFWPLDSYILHSHGEIWSLYSLFEKKLYEKSKNGKYWILYMHTIGPQCKILNYGFKWQVRGADWLYFNRNK